VTGGERFQDDHTQLGDFGTQFLVECPRCGRCALVRRSAAAPHERATHRATLSCTACGHSAVQLTSEARIDGATDWFFGVPLWLSAPCCGETLWAYNADHLAYLERYVGAQLREHIRHPEHGWSNASLGSRLPAWMQSAKNRDAVLACIARLREERLTSAS
jgi:hypothetical protein